MIFVIKMIVNNNVEEREEKYVFRHGVSNPNDIYSVVGLELKFHMKWTR